MLTVRLLGMVWAAVAARLVLLAGQRCAVRVRVGAALRGGAGHCAAPSPSRSLPVWAGLAMLRLLRPVRRSGARRRVWLPEADERLAARLGSTLLPALPVLVLAPRFAVLAAGLGWAWPTVAQRRSRRVAVDALVRDLPEAADLLVLAVGAGCNVALALSAVSRHAEGVAAAAFGEALAEVAAGRRLADALHDLPVRHGEALRPLTSALESSERYGTPLLATLERLAAEVRTARRRRAEEIARRLPVKLLFPLVTCTLPAFGLLTVAPLIASGLRSLRLQP